MLFAELFLASVALSVLKGVSLLVSYINNNAFPQPLSGPEEARYLKILSESKREFSSLTTREIEKARNTLVEHNLRLVAHLVKKFEGAGTDNDDLISIGTIGLIKGINTFDPDKGTRLATYAARCIENEILMYFRSLKKTRSEISIYDPIGIDNQGNEISLIDVMVTNEEDISIKIENQSEVNVLFEHLKTLTKRERLILQLRYGLMNGPKKTQRQISEMLEISRSYVSRIEKKAIQKLSDEMRKINPIDKCSTSIIILIFTQSKRQQS